MDRDIDAMEVPKWLNPDEFPALDCLIDPKDATDQAMSFRLVISVLERLEDYSKHKALGMQLRLGGNVDGAMFEEKYCDVVYRSLPEWALF